MKAVKVLTATTRTRDDRRDPREAATIHTHFAEKVERFEQCLNLGFSNDDIGRYYSKECLVEIALHYMNRGQKETTHHYADFEELTNESLI